MPLSLIINTATVKGNIALAKDEEIILDIFFDSKNIEENRYLYFISQVFKNTNLNPSLVDYIIVSKGPGAFTGTRIGISIAKMFSFVLNKPIVGISTLEAMAYSLLYFKGKALFLLDAKRNEFYGSSYKITNGSVIKETDDKIFQAVELQAYINKDYQLFCAFFKKILIDRGLEIKKPVSDNFFPTSSGFLKAGYLKIERENFENSDTFEPSYIRAIEDLFH